MAVSPLQSFPIPNLSDPANVPSDMSLLAAAVEKKVVMTYASAAAREAAIAAPVEGMVAYLNDVDTLTRYDGSAWRVMDEPSQSWTPVLTAVTTNPTLGTGSAQQGRYIRQGGMVTVWVRIVFGTSGEAAGSGVYIVSLPIAASGVLNASTSNGNGAAIGSGHFRDDSTLSNNNTLAVQLRTTTSVQFVTGAGGVVTEASPIPWAASDAITFTATYPIA